MSRADRASTSPARGSGRSKDARGSGRSKDARGSGHSKDARARGHERDVRALLADERGTIERHAPRRIALVYPSPYRVAMSSLGYQTIYRLVNTMPEVAADRAMLPDLDPGGDGRRRARGPLVTLERGAPVGSYPIVAFSVAYELEIAGLIECLELAQIPVLAADRTDRDPLVVAGGPLTFSNPAPLAPFCDVVVMGEAEQTFPALIERALSLGCRRSAVIEALGGEPGYYVPARDAAGDDPRVPPIAQADDALLPARSQILTPHTELSDMFLTEAVRGCSRGCTYCVMRRSTNGGMRTVAPERILAGIPEEARRVGLVGASVTDHPRIADIVRGVVASGRQVGISSLRADKLTDELVGLLAAGGYRTLTVAADGASERLRRAVERRTTADHLRQTARLAAAHGLSTVKIYLIVGLPDETDADIDELCRLARELRAIHPRIAFGVAPLVAKRNTPLDGAPFAGIAIVDARLARLRRELAGAATVRPVSARWAWVEYVLAQGGPRAGLAVLDAHRAGGRFADYKRAFADHEVEPTGPVARVPGTAELIALRRARRGGGAGASGSPPAAPGAPGASGGPVW